MSASGYTSNPPSGGEGGGGPVSISDVTGLSAALADRATDAELSAGLAGKSATGHGHAIADVSSLQSALDGKSSTGHTHVAANVTDLTEAVQDVVGAMVVAGSNVTATYNDGTGQLTLAASGGGGGGATTVVRRGKVTSGNLTLAVAVSWAAVAGSPELVLPAAAGDYVEFSIPSMLGAFGVNFCDLAVRVGGALVRFLSSDTSTPATEGAPAFYGDQSFDRTSPVFEFVAQAGDIEGGNITVVFATKGSGGGTIYASADYPLKWRAINYGAVSVA